MPKIILKSAISHLSRRDAFYNATYGEWTITVASTEQAAGQQSRTCSVCGNTETQTIASLAPTLKAVKIAKPKAAKKSVTVKWKKISKANQKMIKKWRFRSSFNSAAKTVKASAKKTSKKVKGLTKGA